MDKQQAQQIIKDTFEHPFDKGRFTTFIKNLLNSIDESKAFHARGDVKEMFRSVVKTYERIGTFTTPDDEKIDIIIVYLQKGHSLDHARVTQRNFAGRYLVDRGEKEAGLFAFVAPDEEDWRFSLVKMDYKFEKTETGKMKVKEEFTPARRWSFLVGANERSHTAQSRLVNILANDEQAPNLEEKKGPVKKSINHHPKGGFLIVNNQLLMVNCEWRRARRRREDRRSEGKRKERGKLTYKNFFSIL